MLDWPTVVLIVGVLATIPFWLPLLICLIVAVGGVMLAIIASPIMWIQGKWHMKKIRERVGRHIDN